MYNTICSSINVNSSSKDYDREQLNDSDFKQSIPVYKITGTDECLQGTFSFFLQNIMGNIFLECELIMKLPFETTEEGDDLKLEDDYIQWDRYELQGNHLQYARHVICDIFLNENLIDLCQTSLWSVIKPRLNTLTYRAIPDYETRLFPGRDAFLPSHVWNHGMANNRGEMFFCSTKTTVIESKSESVENDTGDITPSDEEDFCIDTLL